MALLDFLSSEPAPADANGFNAGLMGAREGGGLDAGTVMFALGQSMLSSPRGEMFRDFGTHLNQGITRRDKGMERQALVLALKKAGFSDADAEAFSLNPAAAKVAVDAQAATKGDAAARQASSIMGGFGLGDAPASGDAPRMTPSAPDGPAAGASLNGAAPAPALTGTGAEIQTKFVDNLKAGGLTNPYGLAAVAAYAQHESRYDPKNINGSWSDPSERGQAGTSGGILSWRDDRLDNMRAATSGAKDPVAAQAQFTLNENPELTAALQSAKSPEEANALMADAWKFAGYNRQGGEYAARLATTRSYAGRFAGADGQPPVRVADASGAVPGLPVVDSRQPGFDPNSGADPLAGFVPSTGLPNAVPAGAPLGGFGRAPMRSPVQIADNETQTQALESRMGMLPSSVYGITPETQGRPPAQVVAGGEAAIQRYEGANGMVPGTGRGTSSAGASDRTQVAAADLPSADAREAEFRIPPGSASAAPTGERTVFNDPGAAMRQLSKINQALAVPNLPDTTRKQLEAAREQATAILKPTDQTRRLIDAGYQPGTTEFREAARKLTFGEKDGGEKIIGEARQREQLAEQYGLKRGTPEFGNWVLAGKLPRDETKPLSVADRSAILKADEAAEASRAVLGTLKDAMALSKKAYEGPTASYRGVLTGTFGNEAGQATTEYDNLVTQNALGQLKATFGAAPTEGERKILLDIQGSSSLPDSLRQKLLQRAYAAAERRITVMDERATQLREGDYYKPNRGQSGQRPQGQGQPEQAAPPVFNPADIVDRKTVGGKTYARTSDGRVFEVSP